MKYTLILLCIGLFVLVVDANHDCAGVGEHCHKNRQCCRNLLCNDREKKCVRRGSPQDCLRERQGCQNDKQCCRNLRCNEEKRCEKRRG
ncbi:uncharacterized protein SJCHGC09803-like [Leptopilina boulardi]|uniref:uncharacterized protein SJCHGC09803-like n=1 Tax=Leptopilina boulardi TaxID=63433 RepID=UPI0021F6155B|nr:uncharacterized protein SJCHGC09803-like [Leptopilina boulardi]